MPDLPEEALSAAEAAYECAYKAGVCHGEIPRIILKAALDALAGAGYSLFRAVTPEEEREGAAWAALPEEATTEPQPERTENA